MADVMDMPPEPPLVRDDRRRDRKERSVDDRRLERDLRDRRDEKMDRDERVPRRNYLDRRNDDDGRPGSALARDREYKRRRTPSPSPPPLYSHRDRDRRMSPTHRSPAYKRTKREDNYDGGRHGSPRTGVDDRHDRRMGIFPGRSNSYGVDEQSYGRFRPESGKGGFVDGFDASRREGLMTYKQFIFELEDDISPAEAERRYIEYRTAFISTQKKGFFEQNKQEDWSRDKYDPSRLEAAIQRRNETCSAAAREFAMELESGSLDISSKFTGQNQEVSDEEADDRRRNGRGFAKQQELDAGPKAPAIFCEPRRIEKDIEQARALARKLDGEKGIERNILVSSDLDKSDGGGGSILNPLVIVRGPDQVKGYEGVELLDVVVTYLWRVHYVDYYGSKEYKEQPKAMRHLREEVKMSDDASFSSDWEKKVDMTWQGRLQGQDPLELLLGKEKMESATAQALDPLIRKIKDEKYGWKYGCGAKNCTKLFHGSEFVQKHLKLKHPELIQEIAVKVCEELYFENYMSDPEAPGSDPIMATQKERSRRPPRPTDEPAWVSAGLPLPPPGRGDTDRGIRNAIESDKADKSDKVHEDESFEQRDSEQSPSHDFQEGGAFDSAGPFEGGRGDTAMFDPFGGPGGVRAPPPFGADMGMPPVLMPVPGAGPLGPFVPAPPEVAMRLWREQGGAGPFHPGVYDGPFDGEGNNSRGNRKRPSGGGRGLIDTPSLSLPFPTIRPDSRRPLRSYRDLDALEDEVTVIDYRSV